MTTSYVSLAIRELEKAAKDAGIVVLNEVGNVNFDSDLYYSSLILDLVLYPTVLPQTSNANSDICSVDPGVDHLWAIKAIGEIHSKGGKFGRFS